MNDCQTITLLHDHTHDGVKYAAGDTVSLPAYVVAYINQALLGARMDTREAAKSLPGSPEWEAITFADDE